VVITTGGYINMTKQPQEIEALREQLWELGFEIVPNDRAHLATKLILTEAEFTKLAKLLTTAQNKARIDEHEQVYNKVIEVSFDAFASWSDDRITQLKKELK
jgi:hypothetical protein